MKKHFLVPTLIPGLPMESEHWQGIQLIDTKTSLWNRIQNTKDLPRDTIYALVSLLSDPLPAEDLKAIKNYLPQLKLIANYAVGYNNIDCEAARSLGIAVTNTPGVLTEATANIALCLLLMITRNVTQGFLELHTHGAFSGWHPTYNLGHDVWGKTLGIVGLGAIGRRMAEHAKHLGMKVVALQSLRPQNTTPSSSSGDTIPRLPEKEFLSTIDVISFHCPLTPQTRRWFNRERIFQMKKGSYVINTARGDIIDEEALAEALACGHLAAAGLDVFCNEPVLSPALRQAPRLTVLPHLGTSTLETRETMGNLIQQTLEALYFEKYPLPYQVNT